MTFDEAILLIKQELSRAEKIHPVWPTDKIYAASIVSGESGELVQACNDFVHGFERVVAWTEESDFIIDQTKKMKTEAIHTAVTAIRFLINM